MITANNFDQSSTGVNINIKIAYDEEASLDRATEFLEGRSEHGFVDMLQDKTDRMHIICFDDQEDAMTKAYDISTMSIDEMRGVLPLYLSSHELSDEEVKVIVADITAHDAIRDKIRRGVSQSYVYFTIQYPNTDELVFIYLSNRARKNRSYINETLLEGILFWKSINVTLQVDDETHSTVTNKLIYSKEKFISDYLKYAAGLYPVEKLGIIEGYLNKVMPDDYEQITDMLG